MQSLVQQRVLATGAPARQVSGKRVSTRCVMRSSARASARPQRRAAVECKAFFNFFTPKPAAPSNAVDPRAKPLVEQLIALTSRTDAGAKATAQQKEEIAALVGWAMGGLVVARAPLKWTLWYHRS